MNEHTCGTSLPVTMLIFRSPTIFRRIADILWRLWYPLLTRLTRHSPVIFLNYGYAPNSGDPLIPLNPQDEPDRPCIQLYHHVISAINPQGLDLLEISCGHGGGASYITRYLKPKSMHAIDRNPRAIQLCKCRHPIQGLTFSRGDALALPFASQSFDAVINIEASHCYPDVPRFFSEVRRVLRPGGHFLYADFRPAGDARTLLQRQLEASGLKIIRCQDISPNVVRGMQLNTDKYLQLIRRLLPKLVQKPAMAFAGVQGSSIYQALESGKSIYLCYHLQNPPPP